MLNTVKAKYQNGNIYFEESIPEDISSATVLVTFLNDNDILFDKYPEITDSEIKMKLQKAEKDIEKNKLYTTDQVIEELMK